MITIVDYGMGNLFSVANALERLELACEISQDPEQVRRARRLILPGVGSFREAMAHLNETGLGNATQDSVASGARLLGICLGMQLLAEAGEEDAPAGEPTPGLGLIPGAVTRLPQSASVKVPHMGFNEVRWTRLDPVLNGVDDRSDFYFVHSFRFEADGAAVLGTTVHGVEFASVISHGRVAGMQFHPEKSQASGLRLLRNFGTA
jgi:imidazole glycerol-phosphate synthase subunit HisH